jgi:hypothetical protein
MPDITMCLNSGCSLRVSCWRYLATPSTRQSFALFSPGGENCGYYYNSEGFRNLRTLTEADRSVQAVKPPEALSSGVPEVSSP